MASLLSTKKQGHATLSCSVEVLIRSSFFVTLVLVFVKITKVAGLRVFETLTSPAIEFELTNRFKSFLGHPTHSHTQLRKAFWFYG